MVENGHCAVNRRLMLHTTLSQEMDTFLWNIPRSSCDLFAGRQEILHKLKRALRSDAIVRQKRFVIAGMAGIVKSEIRLRLVEETQSE